MAKTPGRRRLRVTELSSGFLADAHGRRGMSELLARVASVPGALPFGLVLFLDGAIAAGRIRSLSFRAYRGGSAEYVEVKPSKPADGRAFGGDLEAAGFGLATKRGGETWVAEVR